MIRAIIDIGSGDVRGTLLEWPSRKVLVFVQEDFVFQEKINRARYLEDSLVALKKVLTVLSTGGQPAPREIYCYLSAPFYAAQAGELTKTEAKPFLVSQKLVKELIEEKIKAPAGQEIIESEVLRLALDGYFLPEPYGQSAKKLTVSYYFSVVDAPILNRLRETIAGAWHTREIKFRSFALALAQDWITKFPVVKNFLVLDWGREITEVALASHALPGPTTSFPLGANWLIREVAQTFSTSPLEAYSTLKLFSQNKHHERETKKIAEVLMRAKEKWQPAFREALISALAGGVPPAQVVVLADPTLFPVINSWLDEERFKKIVSADYSLW